MPDTSARPYTYGRQVYWLQQYSPFSNQSDISVRCIFQRPLQFQLSMLLFFSSNPKTSYTGSFWVSTATELSLWCSLFSLTPLSSSVHLINVPRDFYDPIIKTLGNGNFAAPSPVWVTLKMVLQCLFGYCLCYLIAGWGEKLLLVGSSNGEGRPFTSYSMTEQCQGTWALGCRSIHRVQPYLAFTPYSDFIGQEKV